MQTNKQKLEHEIMRAVQRYRIDTHKSVTEGAQTAMEILGKYAQLPDSMRRLVLNSERSKKRWFSFKRIKLSGVKS